MKCKIQVLHCYNNICILHFLFILFWGFCTVFAVSKASPISIKFQSFYNFPSIKVDSFGRWRGVVIVLPKWKEGCFLPLLHQGQAPYSPLLELVHSLWVRYLERKQKYYKYKIHRVNTPNIYIKGIVTRLLRTCTFRSYLHVNFVHNF